MNIEFAKAQYGFEEIEAVWRVLKSDWLASGQENISFEKEFANYIGSKYAICVNSGSSANLLALAALQLPKGSKVLTSACGFPATLNPILHLGLEPVLVDYDSTTYNPDIDQVLEKMDGCSAVLLAHTLGFPFNIFPILTKANQLGIKVIEDCCESIGVTYSEHLKKCVGSYGHLGTFSFYPAHQITALGGGGMVTTDDERLYQTMKSMRDWGKMYSWDSSLGGNNTDYSSYIGYHRGYTYETVGWNFKLPEANAAFGREQLKKSNQFRTCRNWNHYILEQSLHGLEQISVRNIDENVLPNPFGFVMTVKNGKRNQFGNYLESAGIKHRPFFAGNITRQPAYRQFEQEFPVADKLMRDTLFVGCWWPRENEYNSYIIEKVKEWNYSNASV